MTKTQHITNLAYRLFLFAWILAVLWVKGYLWTIFTIAAFLLLLEGYLTVNRVAAKASRPGPAMPGSRPSGKKSKGDEQSWREPKPQWSPPRPKG
jgi:hypothetical protein